MSGASQIPVCIYNISTATTGLRSSSFQWWGAEGRNIPGEAYVIRSDVVWGKRQFRVNYRALILQCSQKICSFYITPTLAAIVAVTCDYCSYQLAIQISFRMRRPRIGYLLCAAWCLPGLHYHSSVKAVERNGGTITVATSFIQQVPRRNNQFAYYSLAIVQT